jgi:sulfatase maturation enzyme AslB (radical SAM superfamily)
MPNKTCRLLSNGYKFNLYDNNKFLTLQPCCLFSDRIMIPMEQTDFDVINNYRKKLDKINSYLHPGCSQCNLWDKKTLRKTWRDLSFEIVPDDAELGDASYLEIQLDKTCNGGCIICGPDFSTFWQRETGLRIPAVNKNSEEIVRKILEIIDIEKTKKILFLGGEPFLSHIDQSLLEKIPEPSQVDLQYTTNGSIYPSQERVDIWKKFRSVMINFSIDGIDGRFEYIRYPLKWEQVTANMFRMREEFPDNIRFKINHTINVMNLYYYDEFEKWKNDFFRHDRFEREIRYTYTPAVGVLSPLTVTEKLFKKISEKYNADSKAILTVTNKVQRLDLVLGFLKDNDLRRGLNWIDIFPEISDCLE